MSRRVDASQHGSSADCLTLIGISLKNTALDLSTKNCFTLGLERPRDGRTRHDRSGRCDCDVLRSHYHGFHFCRLGRGSVVTLAAGKNRKERKKNDRYPAADFVSPGTDFLHMILVVAITVVECRSVAAVPAPAVAPPA